MRAYQLAMGLILFQLSIPIASALGFAGPLGGGDIPTEVEGKELSFTNWSGIATASVGFVAIVSSLVFKIPIGATVFATVFSFANLPLASTLNQFVALGYLMQPVVDLLNVAMVFVFIFAFAQLASTGGKGGY